MDPLSFKTDMLFMYQITLLKQLSLTSNTANTIRIIWQIKVRLAQLQQLRGRWVWITIIKHSSAYLLKPKE